MIQRIQVILIASALALTACASIDGTYLPSCDAYSGSKIVLTDGRFHWSKFTDQVVSEVMTLVPDSGESPEILYVQQDGKAVYLLNALEKTALDTSGQRPECVLMRQPPGSPN